MPPGSSEPESAMGSFGQLSHLLSSARSGCMHFSCNLAARLCKAQTREPTYLRPKPASDAGEASQSYEPKQSLQMVLGAALPIRFKRKAQLRIDGSAKSKQSSCGKALS
eukprot:6252610-Amphidinium_carterae.1